MAFLQQSMHFNSFVEILQTLIKSKKSSKNKWSKLRFNILLFSYTFSLKDPLRPVWLYNARSPRITAAAGTRLAGAILLSTVIIFLNHRVLRPIHYNRYHPCDIAGSGLLPLPKIPHCCLKKVGALSQSPCGWSSAKIN